MPLSFCRTYKRTAAPAKKTGRVRSKRFGLALALTAVLGLAGTAAQAASVWTIKDLGTVGGTFSEARDVNDLGQVTGDSLVASGDAYHAYIYKNGAMTDISAQPEWVNLGRGINNAGQVVGYTATSWSQEQVKVTPFLYKNGVMKIISNNPGSANGINDFGVVVGTTQPGACCTTKGFIYKNGAMSLLGTLGGASSAAAAINNIGQVVGISDTRSNSSQHAFLYSTNRMIDLGTLGGATSSALAINDLGQVVGESTLRNLASHAFLYAGGRMRDLGTLGSTFSRAYGINNFGQVVGLSSTAANPEQIPFLYTNGKMVAVNALPGVQESGWVLFDAVAINNLGQIVGRGSFRGQQHAYLLTPPRCDGPRDAISSPFGHVTRK